MTTKLARNPHPGTILHEEIIAPLKLSYYRLAQVTDIPASRLYEIRDGKRGISADTALRLARALGTTPDFWINLQTHYDLVEARRTNLKAYDRIQPLLPVPA